MKKTLAIILSAVMILGVVAVLPSFAAEAYTDAASWIITASSDSIGAIRAAFDGVLEKMNASIHREEETHTINISKGAYDMTFQIWSNLVYVDGTKNGRIRYTLAEPPRLTNGSIYVPIKFITDYLGYSYVSYGNGTVTISKEYR